MSINQEVKALKRLNAVSAKYINLWDDDDINNINDLSEYISEIYENKLLTFVHRKSQSLFSTRR